MTPHWFQPDWLHPANVRALSTTRGGGVSQPPFDSWNLAAHVGDDPQLVARNRALLRDAAQLPSEPLWLTQVHGCDIVTASAGAVSGDCAADASMTREIGQICAVLTADCLPIVLCELHGRAVAAVHAGWRGLAAGIIERSVAQLGYPAAAVSAWLGPCIGPSAFVVGDEVRQAFCAHDRAAVSAFQSTADGRWLADLPQLARQRLSQLGIQHIAGGEWCTVSDPAQFYSYRRDGQTGRMATLIWLTAGV